MRHLFLTLLLLLAAQARRRRRPPGRRAGGASYPRGSRAADGRSAGTISFTSARSGHRRRSPVRGRRSGAVPGCARLLCDAAARHAASGRPGADAGSFRLRRPRSGYLHGGGAAAGPTHHRLGRMGGGHHSVSGAETRAPRASSGMDRGARHYRLRSEGRAFDAFFSDDGGRWSPLRLPLEGANCRAWGEEKLLATLEGGASLRSGPTVEQAQARRSEALLNLELLRRALAETPSPSRNGRSQARLGLPRTPVIDLVDALRQDAVLSNEGTSACFRKARASGCGWRSRFPAISATVLDGCCQKIVANSRAKGR